ncbi:MAG TPA: hypothetical protein VEC14_10830 [Reyranellaceae bacterium]|nr:hypothetical protein [Reyranellaceae bacterium]
MAGLSAFADLACEAPPDDDWDADGWADEDWDADGVDCEAD